MRSFGNNGVNLIGKCYENKMKIFRNFSKSVPSLFDLYILSATRTAVGLPNGVLSDFTATQLASFAIKEALQRAAIPPEDLQNIFLGCFGDNDCHEEIIKRTGLLKTTKVSFVSTCSMHSLVKAAKFLLDGNHKVCLAGGMGSVSNSPLTNGQFLPNFINTIQVDTKKILKWDLRELVQQDYNNFIEANKNGAFYEEILKIDFRKKGQQIIIAADEISGGHKSAENDSLLPVPGDGAACVVMCNADYAKNYGLVPLVKIISFSEEPAGAEDLASAQCLAIERAVKAAGCECKDIARWEMVSLPSNTLNVMNYFNISSSDVNKDGGLLSLGYPMGISGVTAVCHLVHSLSAGELGCVASCGLSGTASAVIFKKLGARKSAKPQLTLYTKHPCPLCDELKQQLKPFEERFSLEEVDIETKENEKYKELYQYDIPVLFLDGVFLCKHRLDVEHFSRRLLASERSFA